MKNSVENLDFQRSENETQLSTCPFAFDVERVLDNLQLKLSDCRLMTKRDVQFCEVGHFFFFLYRCIIPNTAASKILERDFLQ
jgi:hypothetical protein